MPSLKKKFKMKKTNSNGRRIEEDGEKNRIMHTSECCKIHSILVVQYTHFQWVVLEFGNITLSPSVGVFESFGEALNETLPCTIYNLSNFR